MMVLAGWPVGDWQFWVVTVVAVAVAIKTARTLFPRRRRSRRVSLTIDREPPVR